MFWGKYGAGGRLAFSLLMTLMLVMSSAPVAFGQDATPEAPVVEETSDVPVAEPADAIDEPAVEDAEPSEAAAEEPAVEVAAPAEEPVVEVTKAEPVEEEAVVDAAGTGDDATVTVLETAQADVDAAVDETRELYLENFQPVRCETSYWLFTIQPDPGADVQSLTVTFANGNTLELSRSLGKDRANFRTSTNLDSTVTSAVAVVPATFEPTSFQITAGPCNAAPVPGFYDVAFTVVTSDGGSAAGAAVTITKNDGTLTRTGTLGEGNTFLAEDLPDGGYRVDVDGRAVGYGMVSREFSLTNADRSITLSLAKAQAGWIEFQVQQTREFGNARISGVSVTVADENGTVVAEGSTNENGVFRTATLDPDIYTVTIDGRAQGFEVWTGQVSNLRGNHTQGVVLEQWWPTLSGMVVDAVTGLAVADARVLVVDQDGTILLNGTSADGAFVIPNLTPGQELTVSVVAPGYAPVTTTFIVGPEDGEVSIALTPIENVKKTIVVTVDADAVTSSAQLVAPEGSTWTLTEVKKNGKAKTFSGEFAGSLPQAIELSRSTGSGTFTLTVEADGFESYSETVTLVGDEGALYVELVPSEGGAE